MNKEEIKIGMLVRLPWNYTFSKRIFRVIRKGRWGFTLIRVRKGKDTKETYEFYKDKELIPIRKKEKIQ